MKIAARPSRVFFGLGLGLLQLVGYQIEYAPYRTTQLMHKLRVTVAVITYNRSSFLRQTLSGLVRQDYPAGGWELLVIDNNSTDDTADVVASFMGSAARPRRILETRPGLDHGRNRAIEEARGDVIALVDDDILLEPDWLTQLVAPFASQSSHSIGVVGRRGRPGLPGRPARSGSGLPQAARVPDRCRARSRPDQAPMGANFAFPEVGVREVWEIRHEPRPPGIEALRRRRQRHDPAGPLGRPRGVVRPRREGAPPDPRVPAHAALRPAARLRLRALPGRRQRPAPAGIRELRAPVLPIPVVGSAAKLVWFLARGRGLLRRVPARTRPGAPSSARGAPAATCIKSLALPGRKGLSLRANPPWRPNPRYPSSSSRRTRSRRSARPSRASPGPPRSSSSTPSARTGRSRSRQSTGRGWSSPNSAEVRRACGRPASRHTTQPWIFSLDSDERCTPEARDEILRIVADPASADAYLVPRQNYLLGRAIRHGGWYPDYRQPQLFRRGRMTYAADRRGARGLGARRPAGQDASPIAQIPYATLARPSPR
jgi:hypothetical protein